MKQHSYVVGRKKYPKCTVYAGTEDHPSGFVSVQDACNWPTVFLNRLASQFGDQWLCHRLQSWRWTMSTAFSGIGAPESAVLSGNLMLKSYQYSLITIIYNNEFCLACGLRPWLRFKLLRRSSSVPTDLTAWMMQIHMWSVSLPVK